MKVFQSIIHLLLVPTLLILFLFPLSGCASEKVEQHDTTYEKSVMTEKKLEICYIDVYVSAGVYGEPVSFFGANDDTGMVLVPFVYNNITYLPVESLARKISYRDACWDPETMTIEILPEQTYEKPFSSDHRFPDDYPTEITVSYGGITLMMEGEVIDTGESGELLYYDGTVYAPADILGECLNKQVELRQTELTTEDGTFDYFYLFLGPDNMEPHILLEQFLPPPAYLNITYK